MGRRDAGCSHSSCIISVIFFIYLSIFIFFFFWFGFVLFVVVGLLESDNCWLIGHLTEYGRDWSSCVIVLLHAKIQNAVSGR